MVVQRALDEETSEHRGNEKRAAGRAVTGLPLRGASEW